MLVNCILNRTFCSIATQTPISAISYFTACYLIGLDVNYYRRPGWEESYQNEIAKLREQVARQDAIILGQAEKLRAAGDIENSKRTLQALIKSTELELARLRSVEAESAAVEAGKNKAKREERKEEIEHEKNLEKIYERSMKKLVALKKAEADLTKENLTDALSEINAMVEGG